MKITFLELSHAVLPFEYFRQSLKSTSSSLMIRKL